MWSFSTENVSFPNQSQHPAQFYWNLSFKVTVPCVLVRLEWCFEHCQVNLCSVWLLFHFWQISINPTDEVRCFNLLTLRPGKWIFSTSMIELCCLCTLKHTLICWHHCSFFFFPRRFYNMQAVTGKSCAENIFFKKQKIWIFSDASHTFSLFTHIGLLFPPVPWFIFSLVQQIEEVHDH